MKYSRKVRKCAKQLAAVAIANENKKFESIVTEKSGVIVRLGMQLERAIAEADAKTSENISLLREIGQVKTDYNKLLKSNESFNKKFCIAKDENDSIYRENIELQKAIIERDHEIHDKDKVIEEKDDLIHKLQQPWYKKIFG